MNDTKLAVISFLLVLCFTLIYQVPFAASKSGEILFFSSTGCAHCAKWEAYLDDNVERISGLKVRKLEIRESDNAVLLQRLSRNYDVTPEVPTIFVGDAVIQEGRVDNLDEIRGIVMDHMHEASPLERLNGEFETGGDSVGKGITIPAVLGAAAVDAVNPCAFAVLSLLLGTILLGDKNRRKVILAGLAFTCSTFISYTLIGVGLLTAIKISGVQHYLYLVIAIFALVAGLWNVKDFLWYGKWFSIEVPKIWQPQLKKVTQSVSSVPGAFGVGFLTSLFLLPCTSGPYVVIVGMLSTSSAKLLGFSLLVLYNVIFVIPFVLITLLIGFGMTTTARVESWRRNKLNKLHLFTGLVMLGLGITMLVFVLTGRI